MAKKPVNAPGGPAKVFGAENLAYTGPKAANSESAVDGDIQTLINEINSKSSGGMTADTAADAAFDAMHEAVDKFWEESDVDVSDMSLEYTDRHLPSGDYSEEDREGYMSSIIQRFEDTDDIANEVEINVYDAVAKKGRNANEYISVSFSNDDVKRYFDHIAQSEAEFYSPKDNGLPSYRDFI